mgnify:CR=1 FL=1|jgi:hypothetical protein
MENMQTRLRLWKMHPYPRLRRYFPRRGKFALRLLSCSISCSRHHAAKISPSGGDAAVGGRRGAFPAPVRAVVWFSSRQERGCKGFIILAPQAPTTTLTAEGRVKPLHPLHPHARQGVSPSTAHAVPLPHRWGRQVLRKTAHFPIDGGGRF